MASKAAAAGAFGVMVHEPTGPFRSPEAGSATTPRWRRPSPISPSCPTSATRRSGRRIFEALVAAAPNVVAVKYAVPDPVRFAEIVAAGPRLLWICGLAERGRRSSGRPGRPRSRPGWPSSSHACRSSSSAHLRGRPAGRGVRRPGCSLRRSRRCARGTTARRTCPRSRRRWRCGSASGAPFGRRSPSSDPRTAGDQPDPRLVGRPHRARGRVKIARLQLHPVRVTRETGVANEHVIVEHRDRRRRAGLGRDERPVPPPALPVRPGPAAVRALGDPGRQRSPGAEPDRAPDDGLLSRRRPHVQPVRASSARASSWPSTTASVERTACRSTACWAARCAIASPSATRCSASARPTRCRRRSTASTRSCATGSTSSGSTPAPITAADLAFMTRVRRPVRRPSPDQVARLLQRARMARGPPGDRAADRDRGRDAGREPRAPGRPRGTRRVPATEHAPGVRARRTDSATRGSSCTWARSTS